VDYDWDIIEGNIGVMIGTLIDSMIGTMIVKWGYFSGKRLSL